MKCSEINHGTNNRVVITWENTHFFLQLFNILGNKLMKLHSQLNKVGLLVVLVKFHTKYWNNAVCFNCRIFCLMVTLCVEICRPLLVIRLNFVKIPVWQLEILTKILIIRATLHEIFCLFISTMWFKKTSKSCWQLKTCCWMRNVLKKLLNK